jgi:hypothetical protein
MHRHRFDALSFGFGIVIAAIGFWLLTGHVDITDLRLTWVWPLPLILVGLLMLVSARRRDDDRRAGRAETIEERADGPLAEAEPEQSPPPAGSEPPRNPDDARA